MQPIRVRWEGSQFVRHSLALVNRELELALIETGRVDLAIIPFERDEFAASEDPRFGQLSARLERRLAGPAEFHVRHRWPPSFEPVPEGRLILIQPWEYGRLPRDWIEPIQRQVAEVWAYSEHVRRAYLESGIPAERVAVIPLGVNQSIFHSEAPPLRVPTRKAFKFLFVGGTLWRKGIDLLLTAYRAAFTRQDDVCLIIKDMQTNGVYRGHTAGREIAQMMVDPAAPEIVYLTASLADHQLPGLYTAADCLVHPYRAEGFALPVAEALACARPVILTRGGACDDFCVDEAVYWLPASRRGVAVEGTETVGPAWVLEPALEALVEQLRWAYQQREDCQRRGRRGQAIIRDKLTWHTSAERALSRLKRLRDQSPLATG